MFKARLLEPKTRKAAARRPPRQPAATSEHNSESVSETDPADSTTGSSGECTDGSGSDSDGAMAQPADHPSRARAPPGARAVGEAEKKVTKQVKVIADALRHGAGPRESASEQISAQIASAIAQRYAPEERNKRARELVANLKVGAEITRELAEISSFAEVHDSPAHPPQANDELRRAVNVGGITPAKLVSMSTDEMARDSVRAERQRAKEAKVKSRTLPSDDAQPMRVRYGTATSVAGGRAATESAQSQTRPVDDT